MQAAVGFVLGRGCPFGSGAFTIHIRLLALVFGALPRIALSQAITPGLLAFYGRTLTLVCLPLALVGEAIPLAGAPLALIGDAVAAVGHGLPLARLTLARVDGLLALTELLLAAFEIGRVGAVVLRRAFSQGWNHDPLIVNAAPDRPGRGVPGD